MSRVYLRPIRWVAAPIVCLLSFAQPFFAEITFVQTEVVKVTPKPASDADWKTQCAVGLTPMALSVSTALSDVGQFTIRHQSSQWEVEAEIKERRGTLMTKARPGFQRNVVAAPEQDSTKRTREKVDIDTTLLLEGSLQVCGVSKQFNIVSGNLRLTGDASGLPIEVRSAGYDGKEEIALTASANSFRARLFGTPIFPGWSHVNYKDVIPASVWGQQSLIVNVKEPKILRGTRKGGVLDDINFKLELLITD